ncbi:hypothetical protein Y5S_00973 [Alcanivorax nanhaiticus]|uniref:Lipoprotein n=1 Tax=Alcanivorax nanhaiticus TaxID=1177154 RepID=A0A095SN32_9GAMM|nr:hypothetical protein [Alcanivorax nanhaiticus]KGD65749.1 hypothetical protein Y5S_00973 [Alcanivorax nanhaiticus]
MRVLFALTAVAFALAGCNGGEDFSDATVAGCPAGGACSPVSRGDVLIELVDYSFVNLGYRCENSNVNFFTSENEKISSATGGGEITVPPYAALCPANSPSIEFFIGSALNQGDSVSEGKFFSLGRMKIAQGQSAAASYDISISDIVESPRRVVADSNTQVRNVAAFLQGLDSNNATPNVIEIPDQAHDIANAMEKTVVQGLQQTFASSDYPAFLIAWDDYFNDVHNAVPNGIALLDPDPNGPLASVINAKGYSFAGNYRFDTCLSQLSAFYCDTGDESFVPTDMRLPYLKRIVEGQEVTSEPPLVLPNGRVLGLGRAIRRERVNDSEFETRESFVSFSESTHVDDVLFFANAQILSVEPAGAGLDVDMDIKGRFLNKRVYNNYLPPNAQGDNTDIKLAYPSETLQSQEEGAVSGDILSSDPVDLPLTVEVLTVPQVLPDESFVTELSQNGPFTVRLMRACLQEDIDAMGSACTSIDNREQEAGSGTAFNYPAQIIDPVEQEMPREDYYQTTEFCLEVSADLPGGDSFGLVTAGPIGSCDMWEVGFVSRTIESPRSANLTIMLNPGAENVADPNASNFGTSIFGRVDMDLAGDGCYPLYRTGGPNDSTAFDNKVRAAWIDDYLPFIKRDEWIEAEGPDATFADLEEEKQALFFALQRGAVQFFAGLPGDPQCDPLASP